MWPADPALRLTRERLQLASCARAPLKVNRVPPEGALTPWAASGSGARRPRYAGHAGITSTPAADSGPSVRDGSARDGL